MLLLDTMNQQMLERFNTEHKIDLIAMVRDRPGRVFAIGEGLLPKETYIKQGALVGREGARVLGAYGVLESGRPHEVRADAGGHQGPGAAGAAAESGFRLLLPGAGRSKRTGPTASTRRAGPVEREPSRVFATWDEFNAWRQQHGKLRPGAPRIAVSFYKATYYSDETELLDAVIAEIERQGAEAIPMFGYPGAIAAERLLLDPSGKPRADAVLGFNFNFAAPDASSYLAKVDVPVLNLISLYGRSEQEWRASPMGLSMFEGTFNVATPELAGTIAPTVVGSQEKIKDPETGLTIVVRKPMLSQVALAVRRAHRVCGAAQQGQLRQARRDRLLQLSSREGEHRRQLSERRRVDRQRPAAA